MHTNRLVTLADPHSAAAEAYHALRFNLAYTSLDKPLEVLVVSSAAPQTGKSYVAANLGVVMAQAGQRVVLVDADLRRPQLHTLLEQPRDPGLTTAILDEEALSEPELRETSVPGLRLLTSGPLPPNPADILGSQRMAQMLSALQTQADFIILDAPPINVAVDALVVATRADGLLLVARAGHTRRDHVAQAQERLERFRVRLLGAVLLDATEGKLTGGY